MEPQVSILDFPSAIWIKIVSLCYNPNHTSFFALLKQITRCKIASKKLNQILAEYWFATASNLRIRLYRRLAIQSRLESLLESNDAVQLDQRTSQYQIHLVQNRLLIPPSVRIFAFKYKHEACFHSRLAYLLPLAIQHADLPLLKTFTQIPSRYYRKRFLYKGIKVACQLEDTEKIAFLLDLYGKIFQDARSRAALILEALKSDKRLDFSTPQKLIELLLISFTHATMTEKINLLFEERIPRKQAVIIPEGEFLHLEMLLQSKSFVNRATNFVIQSKNDLTSLIYREKNGTMHEIDIATKTDQSDDNKTITYCYEGVETTNINELLLRTSLAERMFSSYPHQLIAVTKQLAALPYEQQPWFKGIITEPVRFSLASDAPNNSIFFTYSSENQVWLSFTTSTASRKLPHKVKIRDGKTILDYLPKKKFVLGLHNGGEVFGLTEHFVRRAVHYGDFNFVKQLIAEHNLDLKTNAYFDEPDNMLFSYLRSHAKETVNNDMIKWLIENGAPLEQSNFSAVVRICNDDVIKMIAETGYHIDMISIEALMQRGCRYDTLTACWNTYLRTNQTPLSLDSYFFVALEQNKFKKTTYNIRTLIMMAWEYDEHCLLRQLPKEVVLDILSYDDIDEPPYWDALHWLIEHPKFNSRFLNGFRNEYFATVFPLVWKNWDLKSYEPVKKLIYRVLCTAYTFSETNIQSILPLFLKFMQRLKDPDPSIELSVASPLARYCLLHDNPIALEIFKLFLDKNIARRKSLHQRVWLSWNNMDLRITAYGPPTFLPFVNGNKPMIELLIDRDLFIDRDGTEHTLEKFLKQHNPSNLHLLQFVDEYRAKKAQQRAEEK